MKRLTGLKRPYRKTRLIFYTCLADNTVTLLLINSWNAYIECFHHTFVTTYWPQLLLGLVVDCDTSISTHTTHMMFNVQHFHFIHPNWH